MTSEQLIIETRDDYAKDPTRRGTRGIGSSESCYYRVTDEHGVARHCAVGRAMIRTYPIENLDGPVLGIEDDNNYNIFGMRPEDMSLDDVLKKKYRGHSIALWEDLQNWHDNSANFTATGLSDDGQTEIDRLLTKYAGQPQKGLR